MYCITNNETSKADFFLSSVVDYVFFENSSSNPYLIRRIEELNKVLLILFMLFIWLMHDDMLRGRLLLLL